jgi:hypothetical protein
MIEPAKSGQPSYLQANRRHRSIFLASLRHALRVLGVLGAGVTLAGIAVSYSPALAAKLTTALTSRLTGGPLSNYARMQQADAAGDHPVAIREASLFLGSIPRPHPADAFGEKYRQALRILLASAEAAGDVTARLKAGELALAFDPNDSALLFQYGRALAAVGRRDDSITMLEAAFRIRPTAPQILHALEAQLANTPDHGRLATLRERHLEALALCMTFPTWLSGNLVASDGKQTKAFDLHLSIAGEIMLGGPLGFSPNSVYMVLPRMPELEVRVTSSRLVGPAGEFVELEPVPQSNLLPVADGFVRITPPDHAGFNDPTVIGFHVPAGRPVDSRLEVRVASRPSPAVAAVLRNFGTWQHPGVKTLTTD